MEPSELSRLFRSIYVEHGRYVVVCLKRLGVPERDIEDVAHECFVAVHRKLGAFDPARPARPWLFVFALRAAKDFRKRTRTRLHDEPSPIEVDLEDGQPSPEQRAIERQTITQVAEALNELDDDKCALLLLHDVDGVAIPEIARTLGIPVDTAYSRLRLARAAFHKSLGFIGGARRET